MGSICRLLPCLGQKDEVLWSLLRRGDGVEMVRSGRDLVGGLISIFVSNEWKKSDSG